MPCPKRGLCGTISSRTAGRGGSSRSAVPRKGVREAVLEYRITATNGALSLADITLHTGRTHQIRVQFASRKHPLWGDGKYGSRFKGNIALQSARLQFLHPETGQQMEFRLEKPNEEPWNIG
mgnify:CR=1 FL=1